MGVEMKPAIASEREATLPNPGLLGDASGLVEVTWWEVDLDGVVTMSTEAGKPHEGGKVLPSFGDSAFALYASNPEVLDGLRRALKGEAVTLDYVMCDRVFEGRFRPRFDVRGAVASVACASAETTAYHRSERERLSAEQALVAAQSEASCRVEDLRRQKEALLQLTLCEDLHGPSLEAALEVICETSGDFLRVERTGIWVYSDDRSEINCLNLYVRSTGEHEQGMQLSYEDNPPYFEALALERAIAADDVYGDPRTAEFTEGYLLPLGISSMLDAPIRGPGRMLGVLCHEHVGPGRVWTEEEQGFAASIGDCIALVLVASERRRMQEQLLQAQKLESIGLLAGGIAHDFNNILTTILGGASHALSKLSEGHAASKSLARVVVAAERAADLTRQMLAYSGKGYYDIKPLQLSTVARGIAELLHATLPKKVQLELELADGLPCVDADPAHLQQILMNLIINGGEAIEAESGRLAVRTGSLEHDGAEMRDLVATPGLAAGSYVYLEVADDGLGMDATTLSRIFDPYFSTKLDGRGLGLAAVVGIVRGLGGAIRVVSALGSGSTFTVFFPASMREASLPIEEPTDAFSGSGLALLVDDEEAVRMTVRLMLEGYGYRVLEAVDGGQALALLAERLDEVVLVVLDVMMPVLDGLQVLKRMQTIAPSTPVVLMSGCHDSVHTTSPGADAHLRRVAKPFTSEALGAVLGSFKEGEPDFTG